MYLSAVVLEAQRREPLRAHGAVGARGRARVLLRRQQRVGRDKRRILSRHFARLNRKCTFVFSQISGNSTIRYDHNIDD
jgi:hypothetical protein